MNKEKVLVAMSGGVDSSAAAHLILSAGYNAMGGTMRLISNLPLNENISDNDIIAARKTCEQLGIEHTVIDLCDQFKKCVVDDFVSVYLRGETPNPCIVCNKNIKFGALLDSALSLDCHKLATGHYAKVVVQEGRFALAMPEDTRKEQTYMLYRLPQSILSKLVLPLSEGTKAEIRLSAEEHGISAANREDSQEICFLPEGNHTEYIESVSGKCPEGDFVTPDGKVIGRHKGIIHYTIGQRKGLGISLGQRAFVTDINVETNEITLSLDLIGQNKVYICDMVYSGMSAPTEKCVVTLDVKLRYTAQLVQAMATLYTDGTAVLEFDKPQRSAPGQSAVLYKDGVVMCGGFINKK